MRRRGEREYTQTVQMQRLYVLFAGKSDGVWASLRHRRSSVHDAKLNIAQEIDLHVHLSNTISSCNLDIAEMRCLLAGYKSASEILT